jgi:hypothetical protein
MRPLRYLIGRTPSPVPAEARHTCQQFDIRQAICELNLSTVDVFLDPATRDGLRCSLEQQALPEVELAVFRRLHLDQRREELESFFCHKTSELQDSREYLRRLQACYG